jgi:hypothetical protein
MNISNLKKATAIFLGLSVSVLSSNAQAALIDVAGLTHLWSGEGNANDSVGIANGTLGANTVFATGLSGQAFSFDGSQNAITTFPVNISPGSLPQMTVGMYINVDSIVNNRGWLLGHDNGGYNRALMISDDRFGSRLSAAPGGTYTSNLTDFSSNLDKWFGIAVAYDQINSSAIVYVNDLQGNSTIQTITTNLSSGLGIFSLGGQTQYGGHTVDAIVDELFIYDRALSQAELDIAFTSVSAPSTLALVGLVLLGMFGLNRRKVLV